MALDPLTAAFDLGGKLVDHFFPNAEKKAEAMLELTKLQQSGELAVMTAQANLIAGQLDINKVEAANPNWFVSSWRPACGWVCAVGLLMQFLVSPLATWFSTLIGHPVVMPTLDMSTLSTLLMGMLGLGGLRTYEKVNGAAGNH